MRSYMQIGLPAMNTLFWSTHGWWRALVGGKHMTYLEPEFEQHLAAFNPLYMNMNYEELFTRSYCLMMKSYYHTKDIYKRVILYENLSSDPEKELKEVFKLFGVDEGKIQLALEALNHDSQNGTFGTRGKTRQYQFTDDFWNNFDDIIREYDLPFRRDFTSEEFKACFK